MEPGFLLSYWRPWNENSSLVDSWGDYLRDTSIAHYTAEAIGQYINEASMANVRAIEESTRIQVAATKQAAIAQINAIKVATELLGTEIKKVREEIVGVNRRLDLSLEMQRTGLILQQNIADLLKIPDSEKERVNHITLGLQFLHNAENDQDLLSDALEEFLKAEELKKQDYFVLHRIGCIYLFAPNLINPELAQDYFVRAGKYASAESGANAILLVNQLTNSINGAYTETTSNKAAIGLLAADSYEKAALSAYVLGDDKKAVLYQEKAVKYNDCPINRFNYSKYLFRDNDLENAKQQLEIAVDRDPNMLNSALADLDISSNAWTIEFVERKVAETDDELEEILFESFKKKNQIVKTPSNLMATKKIYEIGCLPKKATYLERRKILDEFKSILRGDNDVLFSKCQKLEALIRSSPLFELTDSEREKMLIIISPYYAPSMSDLQRGYDKVVSIVKNRIAKIGSLVPGGRIVYINKDEKGWFGLMCTKTPLLRSVNWTKTTSSRELDYRRSTAYSDSDGAKNTRALEQEGSPAAQACINCREGGFDDWYFPSILELKAVFKANLDAKALSDKTYYLWSSTEGNTTREAYTVDMVYGHATKRSSDVAYGDFGVWPIRKFVINASDIEL